MLSWLACSALALAPARSSDLQAELEHFASCLAVVRTGDDARAGELRSLAASLCELHARCDARDVAAYYTGLSAEQRLRGLDAERRWGELREQVVAAGANADSAAWSSERERLVAELRALAERVELEQDFVPAARARALIARIDLERIEEDRALSEDERNAAIERARADVARADELFERAGHLTPRVETAWLAARLALARGDLAAARAGLASTLELATRVRSDDFREHALRGLAAIARAAGDVREETRALERIATFRSPDQSWPLARDWAARLLHEDHADRALAFLGAHEPRDGAHVLERIEWELLCGSARLWLGELDGAREHFERVAAGPTPELAVLALASLALRERQAGEVLDLLGADERVPDFSPLGQQQARALRGEAFFIERDFERAAAELTLALELAEAFELDGLPAPEGERDTAQGAAGSVIGERLGLHTVALLAAAFAELDRPLEALRVIEHSQARSLRRRRDVAHDDLAAWARHFELGLATWVVGADFTVGAHAFVGPDGDLDVVCARIDQGRTSLRDAARRLRESVLAGEIERAHALSDEIRAALWPAALAEHLQASAVHAGDEPRLLWLAHGPLEELPLELLDLDPLAGRAVCSLALPGLPARTPGAARELAELGDWSLIGAPLNLTGHEELPGAREELAQIAELWPSSSLAVGAAATRARMLAALAHARPLHVATHLVPDCAGASASLAASSLLASNGERVCISEIAALTQRPPLVVLAACSTAAGERVDAEGLQGLARAFLGGPGDDGGTRNLIVTLWPVEDGAAAHFARALHLALRAGASPARAVRRARDELRLAGFGPADWAAFRALGRD